ncbi:MAG: zinc-ribbon domain-containing protein [Nanoarchaeota archaeon]
MKFCPNCGKETVENASYCVGCGLDITNFNADPKTPHRGDLPKQEVTLTKFQSIWNKIMVIVSSGIILLGVVSSSPYNVILGIIMLVISFVRLKNKSKTVEQFLSIVSLLIFGIIIISWFMK